jgi:hypothetical protein
VLAIKLLSKECLQTALVIFTALFSQTATGPVTLLPVVRLVCRLGGLATYRKRG